MWRAVARALKAPIKKLIATVVYVVSVWSIRLQSAQAPFISTVALCRLLSSANNDQRRRSLLNSTLTMALTKILCRPVSSLPPALAQRPPYQFAHLKEPRVRPALRPIQRRRNGTFEAGEDESGHINAGPNEGIFFFDSRLSHIIKCGISC